MQQVNRNEAVVLPAIGREGKYLTFFLNQEKYGIGIPKILLGIDKVLEKEELNQIEMES